MNVKKLRIDSKLGCALAIFMAIANSGLAQVVQLPTVRNFSVSSSASVPDGGSVSLGSSGYSATGSTSRGPFPLGTRAIGGITAGASMSASVQIIDLDAMDEALLGRPLNSSLDIATPSQTAMAPSATATSAASASSAAFAGPLAPQSVPADRLTGTTGLLSSSKEVHSVRVKSEHWARVLSSEDPHGYHSDPTVERPNVKDSNIRHYLELGQAAERAGRINSANVHYRMAMDAMSPELRDRYQKALARQAAEAERQRAAVSRTIIGKP